MQTANVSVQQIAIQYKNNAIQKFNNPCTVYKMEHCVFSHTHEYCYYMIVVRAFGEAQCHRVGAEVGRALDVTC